MAGNTLRAYFKRYPTQPGGFASVGDARRFAHEIQVLRDTHGWAVKDIAGSECPALACLLVSAPDLSPTEIAELLSSSGFPQLVLMSFLPGSKKTSLFALVEGQGYRVFREFDDIAYFHRSCGSVVVEAGGLMLGDPTVQDLLRKCRRRISNLSADTKVDLVSVDPRALLVSQRFDIAIKAHYARLWLAGSAKSWREHAYFEHALRITGAGRDLSERDGTGKAGLEAFLEGFHSLLGTTDPSAIPHVPVDLDHVVFDGGHRAAAAISKGRAVKCARLHSPSHSRAPSTFFQGRTHGHPPCPEAILDEAAIEYCRIKDTVAIAMIFPTVASEDTAIRELAGIGDIVYRKDIVLSPSAGGAILRQAYLGQPWLHDTGATSGFLNKLRACFPFSGVLRVILLDGFESKDLRPAKDRIRSAYGIGNHSIHITDSHEETLRVARSLFNQNGVAVLRLGVGNLPGFHRKLFTLRDWMIANGIDEDRVCVDGSAVLSVLGLRECRDLDFLYDGDQSSLPKRPERIDCHNAEARYHSHEIGEITGDPRLHFWYMGVKFCSLQVIQEMKKNRGEEKDKNDIVLIQSRIHSQKPYSPRSVLLLLMRWSGYIKAVLSRVKRRIKKVILPLIKSMDRTKDV